MAEQIKRKIDYSRKFRGESGITTRVEYDEENLALSEIESFVRLVNAFNEYMSARYSSSSSFDVEGTLEIITKIKER